MISAPQSVRSPLPVLWQMKTLCGLHTKLVLLSLAVLVPVVLFAGWMVEQNVTYARAQLLASNSVQAQVAAASLEEYFANVQTLLETLARLSQSQQQTPASLKALYAPALTSRSSLAGIAATDTKGRLVAGLSWDSSQIRSDPFLLPEWPREMGRPAVSGRLAWPATGEGVVGVSVPIQGEDGSLLGDLTAWIPLKQLLLKLDSTQPANIIVVDSSGTVLAHPDQSYLDHPVSLAAWPPVQRALAGQAGVEEFKSDDGSDWVAAYAPTVNLHWAVLVIQPSAQFYPMAEQTGLRWAVFLGAAVLFAVALGILVAARITGPLSQLSRAALAISRGDLTKRTSVSSGDELEQLGGAFNDMAESLSRTIDELHEARQEVERQAHALRLLLARAIRTQEDERARIARDLHDEVNQLLIGALFQVQAAAQLTSSAPAIAEAQLGRVQEILNRALAEVKRVTLNLRPPRLEEGGLVPALRCLVEEFAAATGLAWEFHPGSPAVRLSSERETAVYRVVQESLSNVRRHAQASRVTVGMECDPSWLRVEIVDDGKGFNPGQIDLEGHPLGLTGMRERAESVGGALSFRSRVGAGTTITIAVPLGRRKARFTTGGPA